MSLTIALDETHDPLSRSWVESANAKGADFPLQNLPYGVFRKRGMPDARCGIAIGDEILDLTAAGDDGLFGSDAAMAGKAVRAETLNPLMALGQPHWRALRSAAFAMLRTGANQRAAVERCLVPMKDAELLLPATIGDFSDFSVSRAHNATMGQVAGRASPLHANFRYLPIGYHGRTSSLVASGHPCVRPNGQRGARTDTTPTFGPSQKLDYELELGVLIGPGSTLGQPVPLQAAETHVFGLCILNDWSARDIQSWEITPLGPFQAKSCMTTLSPWIVTLDALAPFRQHLAPRAEDDPALFDYMLDDRNSACGAIDVILSAEITSATMRAANAAPLRTSTCRLADHPWSIFQLLVQQTLNGCNLRTGDLLGTGTASGTGEGEKGCLQELSLGGNRPFPLHGNTSRMYLEDGDEVVFRAWCEREGRVRISFGECRGIVTPAVTIPSKI